MKRIFFFTSLAFALSLAAQTQPTSPQRYTVTDLGPAASPFAQAAGLNDYGLVAGSETAPDGTSHAVIWYWGTLTNISNPGLKGPNSAAGGLNNFGQIIGAAETSTKDPNNENFCGYGTGLQCLAFVWNFGVMTPLPTLGGTNAAWGAINNAGQISGYAENTYRDPTCPKTAAVNGAGPQVLDFEPVVWGPAPGHIQQLPLLALDTVGMAFGINDMGQVVGGTGTCANTVQGGLASTPHAVLWDPDGTVHLLPGLGGLAPDTSILAVGTQAFSINNAGIITGQATLANNTTFHPVLWQDEIVSDLGVLPGDLVGAGLSINNRGEVVGASVSAPGPSTGNPRAFFWRDGVMSDLNDLVQADAPLYLLTAFGINDAGDIVGFGATGKGDVHGFLATPCREDAGCSNASTVAKAARSVVLSEDARKTLLSHGLRGR